MLYKPAGVVTATKDNFDKTVLDLLPSDAGKGLFPVGRLDKDTEGLLLITNDGELAHRLLAPKKHVEKTYYTECSGTISREAVARLERWELISATILRQNQQSKDTFADAGYVYFGIDYYRGEVSPSKADDCGSRRTGHLFKENCNGEL